MTIAEWANRELETLRGQLAYLNSGAARFYDGAGRDDQSDRTRDCIAMIQRQIEEWQRLMTEHGIGVQQKELCQ